MQVTAFERYIPLNGKGLHCSKMKKKMEILNCIEKYRVLLTYWAPLVHV